MACSSLAARALPQPRLRAQDAGVVIVFYARESLLRNLLDSPAYKCEFAQLETVECARMEP
eukprot:6176004-Pleurochrysis_carterae.AAC.1